MPAAADSQKHHRPDDLMLGEVTAIRFEGNSSKGLADKELHNITVNLVSSAGLWRAPDPNQAGQPVTLGAIGKSGPGWPISRSALEAILDAVSQAYQKKQIAAVRVEVSRGALEHLGQPDSDGVLVIRIVEGRIAQLRALPAGPGPGDPNQDPLLQRIRRQSLLQPGDLVHLDRLRQYILRLNRHPGRQVNAALAPGPEAGDLTLDYLVSQRRRPLWYAQINNTGTPQTERCREQFGMVHYNLTGADDILQIDYTTGNFESVHGFSGSYERPLDAAGRLRARLNAFWREYEATEVGLTDQRFQGRSYGVGGELNWNFFQRDSLFADAVAGVQHTRIRVDNDLIDQVGQSNFFVPYAGLRAEQRSEKASFSAALTAEFNAPGVLKTDQEGPDGLDRLGRLDTDRTWFSWRYSVSQALFLEPLLQPDWGQANPSSTLAHELFGSLRGQVTPYNRRSPANFMYTLGGFYTVRGYPEVFTAGDNVILGTVEYRYHWPRGLRPDPDPPEVFGRRFRFRPEYPLGRPDWDLILRGFVDAGRSTKNDSFAYERDMTLVGAGLGIETVWQNALRLRADWGWPLSSANNGEQKVDAGSCRMHVSLAIQF